MNSPRKGENVVDQTSSIWWAENLYTMRNILKQNIKNNFEKVWQKESSTFDCNPVLRSHFLTLSHQKEINETWLAQSNTLQDHLFAYGKVAEVRLYNNRTSFIRTLHKGP